MSDKIPGSSYDNPIWYGKWKIYIGNCSPYEFSHDDYDGADDAKDNRCGYGKSVDDAKMQIDEWEEQNA